MIYPKKINTKEGEELLKILLIVSVIISVILVIINQLITPDVSWAGLANSGIIYIWITVIYSIKRNTNIAGHLLLQIILLSIITLYIDSNIGFYGWSLSIAIPIILIIANFIMLILTIITYKRYIKYVTYQLVIVIITLISIAFIVKNNILTNCTALISIINLIISLIFRYKDIKEEIIRRFHM